MFHPRHNHHEFFAAVTGHDAAEWGRNAIDRRTDAAQHSISGDMPLAIVEGLKLVDVDHDHTQALMLASIWKDGEHKNDPRPLAILTDEPNSLIALYHDCMPLALADDRLARPVA